MKTYFIVIPIELPTLAERERDVSLLMDQFFCERMFILFSGKEVAATNLPQEFRTPVNANVGSPFSLPATGIKLESIEVDLMQQELQHSNGNKSRAASLLGLTSDTFLYRLKKYSISA